MFSPKQDKILLSSATALSWFISSMLINFIGEDVESRKTLAKALEDVVIDFWGEPEEKGMFTHVLRLLYNESLTTKDILEKMDKEELVIDDDYLSGNETDMMVYAFDKLGLFKDWIITVELEFVKMRFPSHIKEGSPTANLYAVRKTDY